jgi:hypothetical protein
MGALSSLQAKVFSHRNRTSRISASKPFDQQKAIERRNTSPASYVRPFSRSSLIAPFCALSLRCPTACMAVWSSRRSVSRELCYQTRSCPPPHPLSVSFPFLDLSPRTFLALRLPIQGDIKADALLSTLLPCGFVPTTSLQPRFRHASSPITPVGIVSPPPHLALSAQAVARPQSSTRHDDLTPKRRPFVDLGVQCPGIVCRSYTRLTPCRLSTRVERERQPLHRRFQLGIAVFHPCYPLCVWKSRCPTRRVIHYRRSGSTTRG